MTIHTEFVHELIQRPPEDQLAVLRPHRFGADPRQQQTRQVAEGQFVESARRHHQGVRPVAPDVLFPVPWIGARQTAQREQPRHEAEIGVGLARFDELIDLVQCGEVMPRLQRGRARRQTTPEAARPSPGMGRTLMPTWCRSWKPWPMINHWNLGITTTLRLVRLGSHSELGL